WASEGADAVDGGAGRDAIVYKASDAGVTVDLALAGPQASDGFADGDVLAGIENVVGSAFADTVSGDAGANTLRGLAGADMLDGREGDDRASYAGSAAAVTVDLGASGPQAGGDAEGDILVSIEDL